MRAKRRHWLSFQNRSPYLMFLIMRSAGSSTRIRGDDERFSQVPQNVILTPSHCDKYSLIHALRTLEA